MPLVLDEVGSDLMLLVPVLVHGVLLVFNGVESGIARSMYIGSTGGSSGRMFFSSFSTNALSERKKPVFMIE